MRKLSIRVETLAETRESALAALDSVRPQMGEAITFLDYQTMHAVLTPKRLEVLRAMSGHGALSIREVARHVGRDFKAVHSDVSALMNAGAVERGRDGVSFPYDTIHVEFEIGAAA